MPDVYEEAEMSDYCSAVLSPDSGEIVHINEALRHKITSTIVIN